jgi:hypothetical protein
MQLLMLGGLVLAVLLWVATTLFRWQPTETLRYVLPLAFYGLATAAFVWRRVGKGAYSVFHIPVFSSLTNFLRFGLATLAVYADPSLLRPFFHGDYTPIRVALLYFFGGALAYWAGCSVVPAKEGGFSRRDPSCSDPSTDVEGKVSLTILGLVYLFAFGVRLYEVHSTGMARDIEAFGEQNQNVAAIQVYEVVGTVGTWCFIALAIERLARPANLFLQGAFWVAFAIECFFGLITGMKSEVLMPFFLTAMISALISKKVNKNWFIVPPLLLIAIYPLSNAFRTIHGGRGFSAIQKWEKAAEYSAGKSQDASEWLASGWDSAVQRMALLPEMASAMNLGDRADWLKGDERWWMVPFYPFVPRFIWRSKPILLKCQRFSIAAGSTATNSEAITIPGDLYLEFGLPGLLIGMFLLGMLGQGLTNMVTGALRKQSLLIYTGVFWSVIFLESDAFSFATGLAKVLFMLWVFTKVIYVPKGSIRLSPHR